MAREAAEARDSGFRGAREIPAAVRPADRAEVLGAILREVAAWGPAWLLAAFRSFGRHGRRLYYRVRELAREPPDDAAGRDIGEWMELAGWAPMARISHRKRSAGLTLEQQIRFGLPKDIAAMHAAEFVFHPTRKWRFDHAFPPLRVALEIEGGLFKGSRSRKTLVDMAALGQRLTPADIGLITKVAGGHHSQPATMRDDMEKYNEAVCLGWYVLRVTPDMIEDGRALDWLIKAFKQRSAA